MVDIPENEVTNSDLFQWYEMQQQLSKLKTAEMLLRKKIFKGMFPCPTEGTNTVELTDGWQLKGGYTIDRQIDPGALGANRERFAAAGLSVDSLVKYEPKLVLSAYRTLTEDQMRLFDEALIVKPGAPSLEIKLPASRKKKEE